jgi:hypothetical protein
MPWKDAMAACCSYGFKGSALESPSEIGCLRAALLTSTFELIPNRFKWLSSPKMKHRPSQRRPPIGLQAPIWGPWVKWTTSGARRWRPSTSLPNFLPIPGSTSASSSLLTMEIWAQASPKMITATLFSLHFAKCNRIFNFRVFSFFFKLLIEWISQLLVWCISWDSSINQILPFIGRLQKIEIQHQSISPHMSLFFLYWKFH